MDRKHEGPPTTDGRPSGDSSVLGGSERRKPYIRGGLFARLKLRTIVNDDGHVQGLEVVHG